MNFLRSTAALLVLVIVIHITIRIRAQQLQQQQQEYEEDYYYRGSQELEATKRKPKTNEEDPCSFYDSCSACTLAKFKGSKKEKQHENDQKPKNNKWSSFLFDWKHHTTTLNSNSNSDSSWKSRLDCRWCIHSNECYSPSSRPDQYCDAKSRAFAGTPSVSYQYDCPLGPEPYPDVPPSLLPNWMAAFHKAGILQEVTLVDLSLPGSHDSLSYDLSLTVSQDGIDHLQRLGQLLHTLSGGMIHLLPGDLEEFFRMQGKTQQLTLTQQLDNGIRFLDFRIMYEPDRREWYSIHFMQSKRHAEEYLQQIREWMDQHPHEVLVIWLSKHGSTDATGQSAYPGVSPEQKRQFWKKYTRAFEGMMQDTNETSIFENSLADLIEKNHRIVSFVSDYAEFTDSSKYAMDAAKIQNEYDEKDGVFDEVTMLQSHINYFKQAAANNAQHNSHHGFTLLAMNTASPSWQVISAAKRIFLHWFLPTLEAEHHHQQQQHLRSSGTPQGPLGSMLFHSCAHYINIPGVTHWCPENLLDISQLTSFYNQIAVEEAYRNSYITDGPYLAAAAAGDRSNATVSIKISNERKQTYTSLAAFPNAFYLDALDYDGTIRTGPQLLDGTERGDMTNNDTLPHKAARYALVDTILAYNARIACRRRTTNSDGCETLMDRIHMRRTRYTLKRWEEPALGRHVDWPPYKWHQDVFEENEKGGRYLTTPR